MIDKTTWDALWQLYPTDMAMMCIGAGIFAVMLVICIVEFLRACLTGYEEEDNLWVN